MPSFLRRLYLVQCWQQNKFLFLVAIAFIGLAFYGHRTRCEITPALDFDMYSRIGHTKGSSFLLVKADGKLLDLFHTIDEPRRMMIFSTLAAYHDGILGGYSDPLQIPVRNLVSKHPFLEPLSKGAVNDSADYRHYLPWLLKYCRQAVDKDIRSLEILRLDLHYNEKELPVIDSIKPLYAFSLPAAK